MLFTSWIALCGWNKFTASLLRAIYSIHAIHFEPHARLPSFLLGNFHQVLPVSLEFHTMSSPVGPTHPPQLQMQLRHSMISTQTWRSHGTEGLLICTHDLCCCVALIWLPLHLCLGQRAALGPCATAFTPQTVPVVHGPLPLISHAHVGVEEPPLKGSESSGSALSWTGINWQSHVTTLKSQGKLPSQTEVLVRTRHLKTKLVLICLIWFISGFRRSINDCTFLLRCFCLDLSINTPPNHCSAK